MLITARVKMMTINPMATQRTYSTGLSLSVLSKVVTCVVGYCSLSLVTDDGYSLLSSTLRIELSVSSSSESIPDLENCHYGIEKRVLSKTIYCIARVTVFVINQRTLRHVIIYVYVHYFHILLYL